MKALLIAAVLFSLSAHAANFDLAGPVIPVPGPDHIIKSPEFTPGDCMTCGLNPSVLEVCVDAKMSYAYPLVKVCGAEPLTTRWLGKITHTSPHPNCMDPGFYPHGCPPDLMFEDDVDVGLRSDGVVVWRSAK